VLINAVIDALSEFGIEHLDMPATPQRVWDAICLAKSKSTAHRSPDSAVVISTQ